jgi:hypothetical protein
MDGDWRILYGHSVPYPIPKISCPLQDWAAMEDEGRAKGKGVHLGDNAPKNPYGRNLGIEGHVN